MIRSGLPDERILPQSYSGKVVLTSPNQVFVTSHFRSGERENAPGAENASGSGSEVEKIASARKTATSSGEEQSVEVSLLRRGKLDPLPMGFCGGPVIDATTGDLVGIGM